MVVRILAVVAAALLLGAGALATLTSAALPLGQILYRLDRNGLNMAQAGIERHLGPWVWDDLVVPVLLRPAWLVPAALGLVCAGAAASLSSLHTSRSSTRRRS